MMAGMGSLLKQQKKFLNLCGGQEAPDLDYLFTGKYNNIMKSELLPSLLIIFYTSTDLLFLDKLVEIMRRCFSQKAELLQHLKNVEILFDKNDIDSYNFLQFSLQELKHLTQCSEVWLVDFHAEPQGPDKEITKILKLLSDINILLYAGTSIDHKGRIQRDMSKEQVISPSRQKIFQFLYVYQPLISFIRDTQNQFAKVLYDPYYSEKTKQLTKTILEKIYQCLSEFCKLNEVNQKLLFEEMQLFLDEIEIDFGQMDLISNIFQDNKVLCQHVSEQLLEQIITYIKIYGRQERFLRIFLIIQKYKDTPILESQLKIIALFIPKTIGLEEYIDKYEYTLFGNFTKNHE